MTEHLHRYAKKGKKRKLKKILKCGADVDALDDEGKTALSYAIEAGHNKCIKLLLMHGADARKYDFFLVMQSFIYLLSKTMKSNFLWHRKTP